MSDGEFSGIPLRMVATDTECLNVISTLVQDSVIVSKDLCWNPRIRECGLLLHRFRWEDRDGAERENRPYQRVQSLLSISDIVQSQVAFPAVGTPVLSLLSLQFRQSKECTGELILTFADLGEFTIEVECLQVCLLDISRPYTAPSGKVPKH